MSAPRLSLRAIDAIAVDVPMKRPLVTSGGTITSAPLLLIDVATEEGITGRAYVFCYRARLARAVLAAIDDAAELLHGREVEPLPIADALQRHFRLVGHTGPISRATAGIDMACWDALAQAADLPLARVLGADLPKLPAYNSCGLGMAEPARLADEAEALCAGGFAGVKIRLGRPDPKDDLAAVRAVRTRLPERIALMADYNQALTLDEARLRLRSLDGEGLAWIEEPIRHDDYAGCAQLVAQCATPIQIGENFAGPRAMAQAIAAGACDFAMPDVERIGGVSGWLQAAALAAVHGVPLSSHLMPEISAHLLAASPTRQWVEYVDWADPVLREPLAIEDGNVVLPERPGAGMAWDAEAVRRWRLE